MNSVNVIGFVF